MSELILDSITSDFGNERRMLQLYPSDLLYDAPNKQWYLWNEKDGIWKRDTMGKVAELVKEMIRGIKMEGTAMKDRADTTDVSTIEGKNQKIALDGFAEALLRWGNKCQNPARVKAVLELLQSSVAVLPDDFNRDGHLFNCRNGTLDLKTMTLLDHNRDHRITFSSGWDYDPDAKCPKFEAFIARLFQNHPERTDLIKFVRMAFGYAISGDTDQQIINLFIGTGNNGKSVLIETIAVSFGDYADSLNGESLTTVSRGKIREDLAKLIGKRFVRVSESGKGTTIDEETVKHLTGGSREPICVRKLYGSSFNFFPKCKIFWSFNHLPKINDMTTSIWRRIKTVPFEESIRESEKRDMNEIIVEHDKERSGILNWLIAGYNDLIETKNFNWCNAVKVRTSEYKEDVDTLGQFFNEVCERWNPEEHIIKTDTVGIDGTKQRYQPLPKDHQVKASDLYDSYLGFSFENGVTRPKSLTDFGNEVTERIGRENKVRTTTGVYYRGLRIRQGMKYENPRKLEMQKMLHFNAIRTLAK